jgi:hypothetical protein
MVQMMAKEKRGWVSTWMAMRRIGWNGDSMKRALWAEKRKMVPPFEMTMNVLLSCAS